MAGPTAFWLLRHALVARDARAVLYGNRDVPLCTETLAEQAGTLYRSLADHLPRPAHWVVSPLSRTVLTAQAIFAAGYPAPPVTIEPDLIEQDLGDWQGLPHDDLPLHLRRPAHPFWPLGPDEQPPGGGETMHAVTVRVGACLERLAARWPGQSVVAVSHGGAIRGALAHALSISAGPALHFAIQNVSVTRLERHPSGWRVLGVNAVAGADGAFALAA